MKIQSIALISLISIVLCSCGTTYSNANFSGSYQSTSPVKRSFAEIINDTDISQRINTAYFADPLINPFTINVDTYQRIVTLGGIVSSPKIAEHATQIARLTPGVLAVNSQFIIQAS